MEASDPIKFSVQPLQEGAVHIWNLRVEPAFARAIDFVVGERLATWTKAGGRASLQLTISGTAAATELEGIENALELERIIITEHAKKLTETRVSELLGERSAA